MAEGIAIADLAVGTMGHQLRVIPLRDRASCSIRPCLRAVAGDNPPALLDSPGVTARNDVDRGWFAHAVTVRSLVGQMTSYLRHDVTAGVR